MRVQPVGGGVEISMPGTGLKFEVKAAMTDSSQPAPGTLVADAKRRPRGVIGRARAGARRQDNASVGDAAMCEICGLTSPPRLRCATPLGVAQRSPADRAIL